MSTLRTGRLIAALVVAGLAPVPAISAAAAAPSGPAAPLADHVESPDDLTAPTLAIDDIGPGRCTPEVTLPGRTVECRFPLVGESRQVHRFDLPVIADLDLRFDDDDPATCVVEGDELVCEDITAFFRLGRSEVAIGLGTDPPRPLAGFEVVDPSGYGFDAFLVGGSEPVAMPGRPVLVAAYPTSRRSEVAGWALVRPRGGGPVVSATALRTGAPGDVWDETPVEAPADPGRYAVILCEGRELGACEELPGRLWFQVIDPTLHELVPGHNRADAERINLVFAGSGFDGPGELAALASDLLALEGPVALDDDGHRLTVPLDELGPGDVFDLAWGPFSIEPLRSNVGRFNFWYLADDLADERAFFHDAHPDFSRGDELDGFELDHISVVTLHRRGDGTFGRSEANWTSFRLRDDVPTLDEMRFAGVYLAIDTFWPHGAATTLAHELGHALFDLRDEYRELERSVQLGYPNCAADLDQAEQWWGDLVGAVDPFAETYLDTQRRLGLWVPEELIDDITVGFETGGCYGGDDTVVRPSATSIMNSELPVFGAVNRRRVEELLAGFSGRAVLASYDDLEIRCLPASVAVPGRILGCRGVLATGVDVEPGRLRVEVGDAAAPCAPTPGDDGLVRVTCGEIPLEGDGPWIVSVVIEGHDPLEVASIENALPPPVAAQSAVGRFERSPVRPPPLPQTEPPPGDDAAETDPTEEPSIAGDGTLSLPWAVGAAIFAMLFVLAGGYLWTHHARSHPAGNDRDPATARRAADPDGDVSGDEPDDPSIDDDAAGPSPG